MGLKPISTILERNLSFLTFIIKSININKFINIMILSYEKFQYYIGYITYNWYGDFDSHEDQIKLNKLRENSAENIKLHAIKNNDLEILKKSIEFALNNKDFDLQRLNSTGEYCYDDEEIVEILEFVYKYIYCRNGFKTHF